MKRNKTNSFTINLLYMAAVILFTVSCYQVDYQETDHSTDHYTESDFKYDLYAARKIPLDMDVAVVSQRAMTPAYFYVTVTAPGTLTVTSSGSADTQGTLFDSNGNLIISADGGGTGENFSVSSPVTAQNYYIRVLFRTVDSTFRLKAEFTPE